MRRLIKVILVIAVFVIICFSLDILSASFVHTCGKNSMVLYDNNYEVSLLDSYCSSCSERLTSDNIYLVKLNYCPECKSSSISTKYHSKCGVEIERIHYEDLDNTMFRYLIFWLK